jgi:hypothetical protein
MSVIRVKKTKNFVTVCTHIFSETKMSFKAKGLWGFCMSRPDDWMFNVQHLKTVSKDGEDAIYSAIDELIEFGYARRVQGNIRGKFQSVDYEIYEMPQPKENNNTFKEILPQRDFPHAGQSLADNTGLLNTDCTNPLNPQASEIISRVIDNTKEGERGRNRLKPDDPGDGIEISKKSFEESKKALREIKIEVDNEEKFIHPRMIDKLAREFTAEEIKNAEEYVAYCLENEDFEIKDTIKFLIYSIRERKSPPNDNAIINIQYARQRKKEWNLRNLDIYDDCVYDGDIYKEIFNSMIPRAFREAFDRTFGPKADALAGGSSWGV